MKVKTQLENQLHGEFREEAQDCLKIYQFLLELDGHVWSREWDALVKNCCKRVNEERVWYHKPTKIGEIFLKGLEA